MGPWLAAAALKQALSVEALAPYATEDNARTAVSFMLGLPAVLLAWTAGGPAPYISYI